MANMDNHCASLEVRDHYTEQGYTAGPSSLADLYQLQAKTQEMYFTKQGRKPFSEFTIGDVVDFLMVTEHAIVDELHEMMDAVGGQHDGVGNAAWKPWKSANAEARQCRISDLSERDLKELKMEWIDVMHFVFNAGLAIGVTPAEFYNLYLSKNEANWERQRNNY
jgi:hypothetical protein